MNEAICFNRKDYFHIRGISKMFIRETFNQSYRGKDVRSILEKIVRNINDRDMYAEPIDRWLERNGYNEGDVNEIVDFIRGLDIYDKDCYIVHQHEYEYMEVEEC